jgi:Magnesium chelatase, subunit ChlI/Integrase core domain
MTVPEALDTTLIHRVAGLAGDRTALVTMRPFRATHHTSSDVGLIGGGQVSMPGEVSLGHHGILSLDEWPECRRHVLKVLRQPLEKRLFQEYGLPEAIRTDNGPPFATPAFCGLSKLSMWWIKLGIHHQRIAPGRPEQNGAHERRHRTLKAEATRPLERHQSAQQARFDRFCHEYNEERPYEALAFRTPASIYRLSPRPMPAKLLTPAYPGHYLVRRVSNAGTCRFQKRQLFLSNTLLQEDIALEKTAEGIWSIYFYDVLLARLDERDVKLYACKSVIDVPGLFCHRCFQWL